MQGQVVADLGCGSGFFTLPAAQMVGPTGTIYAVDVQESKLNATISIANQFNHKNVRIVQADLVKPLLQIPEHSCDLVIIGNILHEVSNAQALIKNAYRLLKNTGRILVVEWKKTASPFGPPLEKRLEQQKLEVLLMQSGLRKYKEVETDGYHYSVLFEK